MQSVLVTFPFLAPPAEGPIDMGPGAKGPVAFSLLLGQDGVVIADAAEPQVVSTDLAMVTAGLVPPQFWPVAVSPPAPLPEIKPGPVAAGEPLDKALPPDVSPEVLKPAVRVLPEHAAASTAVNASVPATGSTLMTALGPTKDLAGDRGEEKPLEPILQSAAPIVPGPVLTEAASHGAGQTEGRHKNAWAPVPFASASPGPHRAGIQPHPGAQPTAARPMVAPDQVTKASAGGHRVTPGTGTPIPASASPPAPAAGTTGPEKHQPEPVMPGIDAAETRATSGPAGPDPTRVEVPPETAPRQQTDDPILIAPPDPVGRAAAKHDSALVPDAPKAARADPEAPIPLSTSVAGLWERIVIGLAEAATPAPILGPKTSSPGHFAYSDGLAVPFGLVREFATEASRTGASVLAPDPKSVPTPPVSPLEPSTPIFSAIAPSPVAGAFDPFDPLDEDTALFASAQPAVHSHPASGNPSAAPTMPVTHLSAQIVRALPHSTDGATELALSPEELGHVRLRLEPDAANPDRMVVMISFERPETLDLFRRHAGELAEAIRAAGYSGADIGFEQHRGGRNPDRQHEPHTTGFALQSDQPPRTPSAPHSKGGTSLDLRL